MLVRQSKNTFVRFDDNYVYIMNQMLRHDRIYNETGADFLKEISRKPQDIEEIVLRLHQLYGNSVSLEVSWKGNAAMDFFFIGILSESDSVNYGLLEIDAQGNRKVLIPEDDDDDEDPLLVAMRPGLSAGKSSLELVNRNLSVVGLSSAQVSIFDLHGRVMLKRQIQGSGALDLSGLRAGAYVVRLKGAGVSETKRIQLR